jgi:hypothetical protein
MGKALDLYLVYEFIRRLAIPWEETDAFKLGIIDDKGKLLKKPSGSEEKDAYNPYNRLIFNIKRLLAKFGLHSKVSSYAAALFLIKECETIPFHLIDDENYLKERIYEEMETIMENSDKRKTFKDIMEADKLKKNIKEDAPTNATGSAVAGTDGNVHWSKKQPKMGVVGEPNKKYGQPIDPKRVLNKARKIIGKTNMKEEEILDERPLSGDEEKKKEDYVKGMKKDKSGFEKRYGDKAKSVMYGTATKMAKEETIDEGKIADLYNKWKGNRQQKKYDKYEMLDDKAYNAISKFVKKEYGSEWNLAAIGGDQTTVDLQIMNRDGITNALKLQYDPVKGIRVISKPVFSKEETLDEGISDKDFNTMVKKIAQLTDQNNHIGARIKGATIIKELQLHMAYVKLRDNVEKVGHLSDADGKKRMVLDKKLFASAKKKLTPEQYKKFHNAF